MSEFTNANLEVLISAAEIQQRIGEIGAEIAAEIAEMEQVLTRDKRQSLENRVPCDLPFVSVDVELLRRVYPAVDIRPLDLFPTERYKRVWDLKIDHLGRQYDVVGVFNFNQGKTERVFLRWSDLGLPAGKLVHVFDFWNKDYLGAWEGGMLVETAPTSCRVLTLLPADDRIQLISTSRHITQGWVDLAALNASASGDTFKGTSRVIRNDPYELRFAFPRGTNYAVEIGRRVARMIADETIERN